MVYAEETVTYETTENLFFGLIQIHIAELFFDDLFAFPYLYSLNTPETIRTESLENDLVTEASIISMLSNGLPASFSFDETRTGGDSRSGTNTYTLDCPE